MNVMNRTAVCNHAKILIADDSRLHRMLLKKIFETYGYEVVVAGDGLEALVVFNKEKPDLVILDIVMPGMDGLKAAAHIRRQLKENYIPIVFITGFSDEENLQRCMEVGADDFIAKPFNEIMLAAKIGSLLRVKYLYQAQLEQKKKIMELQHHIQHEQEIAAALYKNIVHAEFLNIPELKFLLSPMALFNGDILLSGKTPGNNLYIMLGDFTGHGISASIGAAPVSEVFYGMTQKGFDINEVVIEINRKIHKLLPVNMFLAATIVALYGDSNMISLITCGLPDHYLHDRATGAIRTIVSTNLPLGINEDFEPVAQNYEISPNDYLYFFTDGIIEAQNCGCAVWQRRHNLLLNIRIKRLCRYPECIQGTCGRFEAAG